MALPLPASLSPSKVSAFTECGLAFKYSAIDHLPDPGSLWTVKGTLVHRALERLHAEVPAGRRTPDAAAALVADSLDEVLAAEDDGIDLGEGTEALVADAQHLARNVFLLEDPNAVEAIGLELKLEARTADGILLRGVIDRLDRRPDGSLVVVDYKTGRAPHERAEKARMGGVHFYAFLLEQNLGVRPARIELLHLREPVAISSEPTDRTVAQLERRTRAIWTAIEKACAEDDFRPRPSWLCSVCAYRQVCPAWAGVDLAAAG
jgi:putative RecB family exonuclease